MTTRQLKLCLLAVMIAAASPAWAGPGHDHGDESGITVAGDAPRRLPDGSVFLPKPAQRQIGVRTQTIEHASLPRTLELSGRVVMDPNAGGLVQAMQGGRIEAGPEGLPEVGRAVKRGQVLAWVVPAAGSIERAGQQAQLAELRAERSNAQRRVARLRELADSVPRKDIEEATTTLASLDARIRATSEGLQGREPLVAPVDGVIAEAHVVTGQVVDARETLFAIVDPTRLRIEALAYEPERLTRIAGGSLAIGERAVPLRHVGTASALREQALPIRFAAAGEGLDGLALGQTVRVQVQLAETVDGFRVPTASLMKSPSNQTIVWVKNAPERFEPRVIVVEPLDGAHVAVTSGLSDGERVVTRAATLLNQIR